MVAVYTLLNYPVVVDLSAPAQTEPGSAAEALARERDFSLTDALWASLRRSNGFGEDPQYFDVQFHGQTLALGWTPVREVGHLALGATFHYSNKSWTLIATRRFPFPSERYQRPVSLVFDEDLTGVRDLRVTGVNFEDVTYQIPILEGRPQKAETGRLMDLF